MGNANTQLYDKVLDRAAMIRLYEQMVAKKILAVIDGHTVRISDVISNNKAKMSQKLRDEIDAELTASFAEISNIHSRSLMDLVTDQISYTYQNIENAVGKIWRTAKPEQRVTEDIVFNRPLYNDMTLSAGWAGVNIAERKRLEQVIRKGIAEGLTEKQIALEVRSGNVFNITRNQSLGLARTAITSVYAQADQEVYMANKGVLRGWQYVAVLDSRTTPLCAHRDGHVYPVDDVSHLPPAHWHCRSTTVPVLKQYDDMLKSENLKQIRMRNLKGLSQKQIDYYDGMSPLKESYNDWLARQPEIVQLKHLGDTTRLSMFRSGQLTVDRFEENGRAIGLKGLRQMTSSGYGVDGDTMKFANAKDKLDALNLGASRPEDFYSSDELVKNLEEYFLLQAGDLEGNLSYTNYRGTLLHTKKATRTRVLSSPPTEDNLKYNPVTGRYEDSRLYQPSPGVLANNLRLVDESDKLKLVDKAFITKFVNGLETKMSVNERAVIADNLRIVFSRFRENKVPWNNMKAVINSQIKFDVMNVSDYIETQLRKDSNLLHRLRQDNYIDPVLGATQLQDISDAFVDNIRAKNKWEDSTAPKIAKRLRNVLDLKIPLKIKTRLSNDDLNEFYLRFANRLAVADSPDRDQLAVTLGRDLYNSANWRGSRNEWYRLGVKLLDDAADKGFYKLETYGVQKRRMKSRLGSHYFGPYYDTFSVNLRITDPKIQEYSKLTRLVDVGLRVAVTEPKNRLIIREGYKTYFLDRGILGYEDTRIPITSTSSFSDFPVDAIDADMANALNWASSSKYKIDPEFFDFIESLLNFADDKGKAAYYNELNQYRKFMVERGDAYERLKAMQWLRGKDAAFSNHPFLDHRARIYERGFIGPQSGEAYRPFLNTATSKPFSRDEFYNFQDQIGAFLGGLSDKLEGNFNSLSIIGRQKIAEKWRKDLLEVGYAIRKNKPNDIRKVLDSEFMAMVDGEEQAKAMRMALEMSRIDEFLGGNYSDSNLVKLKDYQISLALEQDASSSGAQIIALTTKNKQLAWLSNVIPTNQKQRLYDEIAASTFQDPRFQELNKKLGLTEKDLRKAAKAQNMVTFYGAGEKTGIMNVEAKLAKALGKDSTMLVVKAAERDTVLNEISARMAKYERFDMDMYAQLKALRQDVKDVFNKGLNPGDDILEQLYFLEPKTRDFVEKLSRNYDSVVTPDDFQTIARIMSENLRSQVPILKDFTRFFGRLAEDFVINAKPSDSSTPIVEMLKKEALGTQKGKAPEILKRLPGWKPNGILSEVLYGVREEKLPKKWTNIPWVNFDGVTLEQNFTQVFEERLMYKDAQGKWVTNILQVPQKTDPTWWEELTNKSDKINDIVDAQKARTAFAVNGNHSNDATLVKQFHLWGRKAGVQTSTIHDAFFTNAADMLKARKALRETYAKAVEKMSIKATLDEMLRRGFPKELYNQYLNEAIDIGLIPVVGRSVVGGKVLTDADILTAAQILENIPDGFKNNRGWYGIG